MMKIIAESASNHQGDFEYLKKLAFEAKKSGADFFTVQVFNAGEFCVENYERLDVVKSIEFQENEWIDFFDFAQKEKIELLICALDVKSLQLAYNYGHKFFKVHATDIVNRPFLKKLSFLEDISVLLETQCATYQDISFALKQIGKEKIEAILHGYSNYPTEIEELNLNALKYIDKYFQLPFGLADHSIDTTEIPLMALSMGCKFLEKHITLSRNNRQYDWQVSLYPEEFSLMVNTVKHYQKALGLELKHPSKIESSFRSVLYKKFLSKEIQKRSDFGDDYLTHSIKNFSKSNVGVGIIARLKSQRLRHKVLLPFHNKTVIEDLYSRLQKSSKATLISLITSNISEDNKLVEEFRSKRLNYFTGHPDSVIDRMLSFAIEGNLGVVVRVTGDNPFSDPVIMDKAIELLQFNDLDYVKVNGLPMGVGVEVYSTTYLWELYISLDNPLTSEYLAWIVLNDKKSKKGAINVKSHKIGLEFYNLSIDYKEDLEDSIKLLNKINISNFNEIKLLDIINNLDCITPKEKDTIIKLPLGKFCSLYEFMRLVKKSNYQITETIDI